MSDISEKSKSGNHDQVMNEEMNDFLKRPSVLYAILWVICALLTTLSWLEADPAFLDHSSLYIIAGLGIIGSILWLASNELYALYKYKQTEIVTDHRDGSAFAIGMWSLYTAILIQNYFTPERAVPLGQMNNYTLSALVIHGFCIIFLTGYVVWKIIKKTPHHE